MVCIKAEFINLAGKRDSYHSGESSVVYSGCVSTRYRAKMNKVTLNYDRLLKIFFIGY